MNPMDDRFAFQPELVCEEVASLLPLMYSDEISPDDLFHVHYHLESCIHCRRRYQEWGDLIARSRQLLDPGTGNDFEIEDDSNLPSFHDLLHAAEAAGGDEGDEQEPTGDLSCNDPDDAKPDGGHLNSLPSSEVSSPSACWTTARPRLSVSPSGGSLTQPDPPDMREDIGYSAKIATRLLCAYDLGTRQHFTEAIDLLLPLVDAPIARSQAIRAHYYLGLYYAALEEYSLSTRYLDEAADWAICSDNMYAVAQIGHALGENHYYTLQCASAIEYYTLALDALDVIPCAASARLNSGLQDLRITAMLRLASQYFLLADFDEARRVMAAVRTLLPTIADAESLSLRRAEVAWTSALLNRWRGDFTAGMKDISEALDVIRNYGSPLNRARAHIVMSDIILDVVDRPGFAMTGSALTRFAHLAEPYTIQALQQTSELRDTSGEFMAGLAHIRLLRATNNQAFDRGAILECMVQQAEQAGQRSLLGQVYTALGDEFLSQDDLDRAGNCYRNALDALAETDIPAYTIFPRRALHVIREGLVGLHSSSCV